MNAPRMETLVIFARWPAPGRVKSRLAPALPAPLACDLHRAMLADTMAAARGSRAGRRVLAWADAPDGATADEGFLLARQRGDDLGARLAAAFEERFRAGDAPVVIVGSDAPEIDASRIDAAFAALAEEELVLGPCEDGGFSLVGLARPQPALLEGVPWSTPDARAAVEARAASLGTSLATLAPLPDVDTAADLVALLARLIAAHHAAPATASALRTMGLLPPRD